MAKHAIVLDTLGSSHLGSEQEKLITLFEELLMALDLGKIWLLNNLTRSYRILIPQK